MGLVGRCGWVHSRARRHGCGEVTTVPRSVCSRVVTVNDVLDGHTVLDVSCLDRLYLSGFVQRLQILFLDGRDGG